MIREEREHPDLTHRIFALLPLLSAAGLAPAEASEPAQSAAKHLYQTLNAPAPFDDEAANIDHRHPLDIARSRIRNVWEEMREQLPSARDASWGVVSKPRDAVEEELEQMRGHRGQGRIEPAQLARLGWLSLADLQNQRDDELLGARAPAPMPEPGLLVAFGVVGVALARRRHR